MNVRSAADRPRPGHRLRPMPLAAGGPAVLALVASGCSPRPATIEPAAVPEGVREQAVSAKEALFERLSSRLKEALTDGGPAAAIAVCSEAAPRLAREVSESHGVRIGRTSFRLRNPDNAPPAWAQPLVESRVEESQFVRVDDQTVGALLPIKLQSQCLLCHGPKSQLAPGVAEQLAALYPGDRATGFEEGDLRGWFWVEVPGASAPAP